MSSVIGRKSQTDIQMPVSDLQMQFFPHLFSKYKYSQMLKITITLTTGRQSISLKSNPIPNPDPQVNTCVCGENLFTVVFFTEKEQDSFVRRYRLALGENLCQQRLPLFRTSLISVTFDGSKSSPRAHVHIHFKAEGGGPLFYGLGCWRPYELTLIVMQSREG